MDIPIVAPSYYDDLTREAAKENGAPELSEQLLINPGAKFQITKLDHDTPLFKISDNANAAADPESIAFSNLSAIDGQIYQTSWSRLLGTELIFDDYGEVVGTVREHLVSDPTVSVKPKQNDEKEDAMDIDSETEETDTRTAFLRRAIAAAKAKK